MPFTSSLPRRPSPRRRSPRRLSPQPTAHRLQHPQVLVEAADAAPPSQRPDSPTIPEGLFDRSATQGHTQNQPSASETTRTETSTTISQTPSTSSHLVAPSSTGSLRVAAEEGAAHGNTAQRAADRAAQRLGLPPMTGAQKVQGDDGEKAVQAT